MIYDLITNLDNYLTIHPLFNVVSSFIGSNNLKDLEPNEIELSDGIKAIIAEYETDTFENKFIECHKKYIDIQLVISGEEQIGYANINECDILEPYNEEKDLEKLSGSVDVLTFGEGYFSILFPQDGHMPGLTPNGEKNRPIKKIVFKVPVK